MEKVFTHIRDALAALRESVRPLAVFGSQSHKFRTHPSLIEEDVLEFERAHRVALPVEYRQFLINVGNGGAGPAYGLFKLGEMDDGFKHEPWIEGGGFVGILSQPFPHIGPWNDLSEEPLYDDSRETDPQWEDEYQRQLNAWEDRVYWNPVNVNGAVPICHLGCGYRQWLVVTGPEAGNVWCDDRVDKAGLRPLEVAKTRVSFLRWYLSWLDDALSKRRK